MTENIIRIDNIKKLIIQHNASSFKLDSDNNILKVKRTNFIKNILHYLISENDIKKLFFSKKKNKSKAISPIKLLNFIVKKLPKSRGAHPYIFFLFHDLLTQNYDIEYKYFEYVDTFEIRSKDIKIREQIQESFKIVDRILSDKSLKDMSPTIYDLFLNQNGIKIEEKIKTGLNKVKHRFIDLSFQTSETTKVYLEINEQHHVKDLDLERAVEIYIKNNTHPIMIYKEELDLDEIIEKVWREIAFSLFSENKKEALIIYLTKINKIDIDLSKFFIDIQMDFVEENEGIPLANIYKYLKKFDFKNFYKFVENMIESCDLNEETHFISLDKKNIKNSVLNKFGYDTLLMLPRKEDWSKSLRLKNTFSEFKTNYLGLIQDLMSNQFDRLNVLKEAVTTYKKYSHFTDSAYNFIQDFMNTNREIIQEKLNIKLHSKIWCLKYEKGSKVPFYELQKFYSDEIVDFIRENNENKQNILNYEIINSEEFQEIIKITNSKSNSEDEIQSDEELLDF